MIDPVTLAVVAGLRLVNPQPIDLKNVECLADAIYFESRNQPLAAQVGVASAVVNRGRPCAVVRQPHQFSYRKIKHRRRTDQKAWKQALEVAVLVHSRAVQPYEATHFHDTSVTPAWTARMTFIGQAGDMKFWRAL